MAARVGVGEGAGGGRDCIGGGGGMLMPSNRGSGPGLCARSGVGSRPA